MQAVQQPGPALGAQGIQPGVGGAPRLEVQLPAHQGGQAVEGVQQPLVPLGLLRGGGEQALQVLTALSHRVQLVLGGGELVKHAGEQGPLLGAGGAQGGLHPAHTVQNAAGLVQEDQVGPAADGLQHQLPLHPVPQLVEGLQGEDHHPLQPRLFHRQQPGAGQVLAQEHTEHGGLVRVFPAELGQLGAGMVGIGGQQQPHVPVAGGADGKEDLVPAGLIDLVQLAAGDHLVQLMDQAGQAQGV